MVSSARVDWVIADCHTNLGDTLIAKCCFFSSSSVVVVFDIQKKKEDFLFFLSLKKLKRTLFIMTKFVFCHHNFNKVLFNLIC